MLSKKFFYAVTMSNFVCWGYFVTRCMYTVNSMSASNCVSCMLHHQRLISRPTIIYSRQVAAVDEWDVFQRRWRTHRCRMTPGTTSRRPRRRTTIWHCTSPTSVTSHSSSSTSSSELSAFLTTCSYLSSSSYTSRSQRRYWRRWIKNYTEKKKFFSSFIFIATFTCLSHHQNASVADLNSGWMWTRSSPRSLHSIVWRSSEFSCCHDNVINAIVLFQ